MSPMSLMQSDAVTEYTFDANGNRLSITEPNGNITTYVYNALDRVTIETNTEGESTRDQLRCGGQRQDCDLPQR